MDDVGRDGTVQIFGLYCLCCKSGLSSTVTQRVNEKGARREAGPEGQALDLAMMCSGKSAVRSTADYGGRRKRSGVVTAMVGGEPRVTCSKVDRRCREQY